MDNRPIGVFDSGLGGLTAVKELQHVMPHEDIIYFGDTGRVPYGSRSKDTILKYTRQDIAFLRQFHVKMVIAACGTVSSVAPSILNSLDIPATGVLHPTAEAAARATKNGKIAVIGTTATIRSGSYQQELKAINPELSIFCQDCPLFVPLVENGFVSDGEEITRLTAERYLAPLKKEHPDTLIMGCTHYPIISHIIARVMGEDVTLIDSGRETALYAFHQLEKSGLLCEPNKTGSCHFHVSDHTEGFSNIAEIFLGRNVQADVEHVEIEDF